MANSGSFNTGNYKGRYLVFAWEEKSQSIENNTTTISWTMTGAGEAEWTYYLCQNIKVTISGETVFQHTKDKDGQITLGIGTVVASGEYTFKHNSNGTKNFTAYAEAGIYVWDVNVTGTGTFTLDTIPRASSLTAANGTLDVEQTLTINRAASTFKHRLTYRCGDVAGYIAGSATGYTTATSIKWTPLIGLAHENTEGTSVSVTLTLYTYAADGTHIGTTTETITCAIPTTVKPSVSISWKDLSGAAGTYGNPVQGISRLEITLTEQTSYSSPIASRSITVNGVKYTESPATTEPLAVAGSQKIAATIKDKRGRTGSNSAALEVLAYTAPVISALTVHRCDEDGTENDQGDYIKAVFSAAITPLNNKNTAVYKLRHKDSEAEDFTEVPLPELTGTYAVRNFGFIFEADGNSSHDVEVAATDNHGTATRATSASTAFTLLNWHPTGTGMGVGKVSERENAVEFGLDLYDKNGNQILGTGALVNLFLPVGSVVIRYDTINPGTIYTGTTWTQITARILRAGSAGSVGAEGSIADGSGRTYVDVAVWRRTA